MSIDLSPAFFDLQLRFADNVAEVSSFSFEEAVLNFTNIYLQCLGRSFDASHPAWQSYLEGLRRAEDRARWTFDFYESRRKAPPPSPYGCFQYHYLADERTIRIHFANADASGYGPLSRTRMPVRLQELKAMFAEVKQRHPDAQMVRGNSWAYNLEAYRRLFPPQYTSSMKVVEEEFQYLSLWGQFLQRDGQIRPSLAHTFLSCCRQQRTPEGLAGCFPYQVLAPSCFIDEFYNFYECLWKITG